MLLVSAEFPESLLLQKGSDCLPTDWRALPYARHIRDVGDQWIQSDSSLAMSVPSALVPRESTILINPDHRDFHQLRVLSIEALVMDPRLIRRDGGNGDS